MVYRAQQSEELTIRGHNGDEIQAYYARPQGGGPFPGVVVIHHMPGWDEWTTEVCRKLAHHGYAANAPHLNTRLGPGQPDDLAARARAEGGAPDDQVMGDVQGSIDFLRSQPTHNGKIGVIGFCSGGRHTYLAACQLSGIDAAVDCWGGGVSVLDPSQLTPSRPYNPVELTDKMTAPLLGIFGNDDQRPDIAEVNRTEEKLKSAGKTYEFHRYDGAGHGFFNVAGAGYRVQQAQDGWQKVLAFYDKYLKAPVPAAAGAGRA
jgi:carboxymethylenebutenolidase